MISPSIVRCTILACAISSISVSAMSLNPIVINTNITESEVKAYPELWGEEQLPHESKNWDLFRFAVATPYSSGPIEHQASAKQVSDLLRNVTCVASMLGAQTLVTVSTVGLERLLRLKGVFVEWAGLPMKCYFEGITSLVIGTASLVSLVSGEVTKND
jgi:hypothetical protein